MTILLWAPTSNAPFVRLAVGMIDLFAPAAWTKRQSHSPRLEECDIGAD